MNVATLLKHPRAQKVDSLKGWVIFNRGNNKVRFITFNDGSSFDHLQVVLKNELATAFGEIRTGAAVEFAGVIHLTPTNLQPLELVATKGQVLANADPDFPIQKQEMSREVLREMPHLRHRTQFGRAVMRVRSVLQFAIHQWFNTAGFINVTAPIITSNDGEGAGETFFVDAAEPNFFGKTATLGVTGQLHAEAYATGFGRVYTFAPTFRAERSHTSRHAAEFWMVEPEVAFGTQRDGIKLADDLVRYVVRTALTACVSELTYLDELSGHLLLTRLQQFLDHGTKIIEYTKALTILSEVRDRFKEQNFVFGVDLATEHERYLAEVYAQGPIAVINYPREIKAFYMLLNDDQKTVACYDILVPGIGELVGGSARETDIAKLTQRMQELHVPVADLMWYLNLRRFGEAASVGFGLGFERLVMYVTGVENIRDVIPYPRTPNNLLF